MRKVFINGRFLTQQLTGVQRTAVELVTALDRLVGEHRHGAPVCAYSVIYSGKLVTHLHLRNIPIRKKGWLRGNLWEQLELPVYTAGHFLVSLCTISCLFKRNQAVLMHDASALVNPQFFSRTFRLWYRFALPLLGRRASQILTVSQFSAGELSRHAAIPLSRIAVIPNAADHILKYDAPGKAFMAKIEELKPYCLGVSSLGANKNFGTLATAVGGARLNGHNVLVAGTSSSVLRQGIAQSARITYLGYVSNEELKYLYRNATIFAFPSFYEGFGIPPLEAMICGCPVISSGTSALPETLGDAPEYFDPEDAVSLREKIELLLGDPPRRDTMKRKGIRQASSYSWLKSADLLRTIIDTNGKCQTENDHADLPVKRGRKDLHRASAGVC